MFNPMIFALNVLGNNPRVTQDPRNKELIDILKSGDAERGAAKARELCQSNNTTPEEAAQKARSFFRF